MQTNEFLQNMAAFTQASLTWCSDEALKATQTVFDTIQTLQTMDDIVPDINTVEDGDIHDARLAFGQHLNKIAEANNNVQAYVSPILQTLQFQDAISQQMQSIIKMLHTWIEIRTQLEQQSSTITDVAFGEQLLAHTTSTTAADQIRKHIPDLPEIEVDDDTLLF